MAVTDLSVRPAFLKTSEKFPDRFLFCGKVQSTETSDNFYFYLIEILSPWFPSSKVKKIIRDILDKHSIPAEADIAEKSFEDVIFRINEALGKLAAEGERDWVGNLNAVIGLAQSNRIIIAQTGNLSGYLFHKGKISRLLEKTSPSSPLATFEEITSGQIAPENRLLLANAELFNHFSLDQLRRVTEGRPIEISLHDIFKMLRKIKVHEVNAVLIEIEEANHREKTEGEILPTELLLDEPEESLVSIAVKRISPYAARAIILTKNISDKLVVESKHAWDASKKEWQNNLGPKTKKLLGKSNARISQYTEKLTKNALPAINKTTAKFAGNPRVKHFDKKIRTTANNRDWQREIINFLRIIARALRKLLLPRNRKILYALCILLVFFVGFLKIKANREDQNIKLEEKQIVDSYTDASRVFDTAKEDIALGKTSGLSKLTDALVLVRKAKNDKANEAKAIALEQEIQKTIDIMNKTMRFTNPAPLFSFSAKPLTIVLAGSEIYSIDEEGKIFAADTRDKEARLVASIGKENGESRSLSYSKSTNKIFIYTNTKKVLSYDLVSKTFNELRIIDGNETWEDAKSVASFVSNIYLLDSEAGTLWKHVERDGGYSKGSTYANTKTTSIRGAVDLTVDGDFYILRNDGKVSKFSKGVHDASFTLKPLPAPGETIDVPAQIATDPDAADLFILDKKLNRIVRFSKTGEFISQFVVDGITIDRFVMNSKVKKLWALSDNKVYELDL